MTILTNLHIIVLRYNDNHVRRVVGAVAETENRLRYYSVIVSYKEELGGQKEQLEHLECMYQLFFLHFTFYIISYYKHNFPITFLLNRIIYCFCLINVLLYTNKKIWLINL